MTTTTFHRHADHEDAQMDNFDRYNDGSLARYTSIGSYPLLYTTNRGNVLCFQCACEVDEGNGPDGEHITSQDVNWENASLYCDGCEDRIESAYAEPDENENAKGD